MKRFYTLALSERDAATGLHRILLDTRPMKTPAKAPLAVPSEALAAAIVSEWAGQGEKIDATTMPVTGFANATIDQILPDVAGFRAGVAAYGANDLLCYRAEEPAELVNAQATLWNPILEWAQDRYGVTFAVTGGIMPVNQPAATVERLHGVVDGLDPWLLSAFSTIVSITGSLIGALALVEGALTADALWSAVQVDEDWQVRQWGEDAEATARTAIRRAHYDDAARYCALVAGTPDTLA